jgi:hypothetical protein
MLTTQSVRILDADENSQVAELTFGLTLENFRAIDFSWREYSLPTLERVSGIKYTANLNDDSNWREFIKQVYGRSLSYVPGNIHWSWTQKQKEYPKNQYNSYAITCNNQTQGVMVIRDDVNKKQQGMVYIDYLATAPWNLEEFSKSPPRYKRIGYVLMATAVTRSRIDSFDGRLGLHSLSASENFYRKIGMTDYGEDSNYDDLRYFEMDEIQANRFHPRPEY